MFLNFWEDFALFNDITERKHAEEKIAGLLAEKELLLKEIHHRIKNNMAVIAALLSLQANSTDNAFAANALNEARSRVQSMVALYDKLYQESEYLKADAKPYLGKLISDMKSTYLNGYGIQESRTEIKEDIDSMILDTKQLMTIGLIINELLTNALKHAFPKA